MTVAKHSQSTTSDVQELDLTRTELHDDKPKMTVTEHATMTATATTTSKPLPLVDARHIISISTRLTPALLRPDTANQPSDNNGRRLEKNTTVIRSKVCISAELVDL